MPFVVKAHVDDLALTVNANTAKEAFAKAVEWQVTGRFNHVSISDSTKTYSIEAFALAMALLDIAKQSTPRPSRRRKANDASG